MTLRFFKSLFIFIFLFPVAISATGKRKIKKNDFDWYFFPQKIDLISPDTTNYSLWEKVDLPHDYSIEGTYDENNRRENGFVPGGNIVWYKKEIEWNPEWDKKRISIEFDGAYMNSTVWLNGHKLGYYPNGYFGFAYSSSNR